VIAGILIGSITVSSSVFATHDKKGHGEENGQSSSNANIYVNSLSFDYENPDSLDSCSVIAPPCILLHPIDPDNEDAIFIADPALLNTRTIVAVNVNEQNNFPTSVTDILTFPECFTVTLANFNDVNGVYAECNSIESGIIDVTYSFTDPQDDDATDPPTTCEIKGVTTYSVDDITGDVTVIVKQSRDLNDNSYGVNSINWGTKVHKFRDLTGSDKMEFKFTNSAGDTVLDFYSDYLSLDPTNTVSGYSSLGVNGGDGKMISGNKDYVLSWDTSMAQNLNTHGYFVGKVQTPPPSGVLVPNLLIDSPKTLSNTSYTPADGSPFTAWDFNDTYTVKISNLAFPGGFVAGGYQVIIPDFHNSPEKVCGNNDHHHDHDKSKND
jgi:hypothetical protein